MARTVKLGLIGCGGFMQHHVNQILEVKSAEIAALVDPSRASIRRMVRSHPSLAQVPRFADYRDMLAEAEIDGAVIASPHSLHFEQIMGCLEAGVHVLCEKPMVCRVDQAGEVIRKAKRKKLVVMVSYQRHVEPAFRCVREMIAEGKLGGITFVSALLAQEWLRGTKGTWRQDPKLSCGGELNDSGSHLIDIILWVTGLVPSSVFARIDNCGTKVDILSALTFTFKGGAMGNLSVVGDAPGWWEEITFYGKKGALYYRDGRLFHHVPNKSGWGATVTEVTKKVRYRSTPDKNFVNSILGKEEPQSPPECGLRVAQLTTAAWESARTGKPVKVRG